MSRTALLLLLAAASFAQTYQWSPTGPLQVARHGACAAALPDGRILVAGGTGLAGTLRSVEIYQSDGTFLPAPDLLRARAGHTCTTLADGRVLAAGGIGEGLAAELFDPAANAWSPVDAGAARWGHTATLLPDGRVLLSGGVLSDSAADLLEWYLPAANRLRALPARLAAARTAHAAAALPDGSVLISGGWNGQSLLDSAELVALDGSVTGVPALPAARAGHTATALSTGCILLTGGLGVDGDLKSTALYCADPGAFRAAPDMSVARFLHLAIPLPDNGAVLVTGGFSQGEPTAASELYDPAINTFLPAGSLTRARLGIAGAADPVTGAVLAVGGVTDDGPLAACGILRGPTIAFDKVRYVDGDAVTVAGLGWKPGETVSLQLTIERPSLSGTISQISSQSFTPVASALGRVSQTLFNASAQNAGVTYRVTATGAASGLVASNTARQVSRTTLTLNVSPFPALTRQPVTLQAIVQPQTNVGLLDGQVDFQIAGSPLGSVSSTGPFTSVSLTGQITDGSSNTIQAGQTATTTGFSRTFTAPDGSVRSIPGGGAFQLTTLDLPAGNNVLSVGPGGSVSAAFNAFTSLYAPSSAAATVSVQKRTVNVTAFAALTLAIPKVGEPVELSVSVSAPQQPFADVTPTGNAHLTLDSGNVIDAPLSPALFNHASRAVYTVLLPAGKRTFSAQYDGDAVYLPGTSTAAAVSVAKGAVGFALTAGKSTYTVGEPITLSARITHPKVPGATPTGQITRSSGPAQFQGAAVGADPNNTGTIDTNLPVSGFPSPGNFTVTMAYGGDANFQGAIAGAIFTVARAVPQITVIPPAQIVAGQEAVFAVRAVGPSNLAFRPPVSGQVTLTGVTGGATANLVASTSSVATLRQTFSTPGTFTIAVQYAGDANYQGAASAPVQIVVQ